MVNKPRTKSAPSKPAGPASPRLSNARIVGAAMHIADNEGLQAISMRRIAEELGAGAMSLYRHVSGKDQILDLLLDAAYGEISVPDVPSGNWREDLWNLARQTRGVLKRHWWLGPLLTTRPTFGPNYLRWFEFQLASTGAAGLDMQARTRAIGTVFAYVAGVVGYELGEEESNRRHNLTPERKRALAAPLLAPILATGLYPNLAQFVEVGDAEPTDESFEFGLGCVLDGVASHTMPEK
jgi:AcrR family transcriptional regulator